MLVVFEVVTVAVAAKNWSPGISGCVFAAELNKTALAASVADESRRRCCRMLRWERRWWRSAHACAAAGCLAASKQAVSSSSNTRLLLAIVPLMMISFPTGQESLSSKLD
jgi:hypothetical protein